MASLITQEYKIDLIPDLTRVTVVHVGYYDTMRHLKFTLYNNGVLYTIPKGVKARVEGTKKNNYYFSIDVTPNGTDVEFDLQETMCDAVGDAACSIILFTDNQNEIASANFVIQVSPTGIVDQLDLTKTDFHHYLKVTEALRDETKSYRDEAKVSADRAAREAGAAVDARNRSEAARDRSEAARDRSEAARDRAETAANNAATSANNAKTSENNAKNSATAAQNASTNAVNYANIAKSWAVGPNGSGTGSDTNNAKYYAEQIKQILSTITNINSLIPCTDEEMNACIDMFQS